MLRAFTDSAGVEWRVWSVIPNSNLNASRADSLSQSSLRETAFANGWLCFESLDEKRRLAPIPPEWEDDAHPRLEEWCSQAVVVPPRQRKQA